MQQSKAPSYVDNCKLIHLHTVFLINKYASILSVNKQVLLQYLLKGCGSIILNLIS